MTANVGNIDRLFRLVLGVILVAAPFVTGLAIFSGTLGTVISVIVGLVLLGTSAIKFCPLYRLLRMQTCPR